MAHIDDDDFDANLTITTVNQLKECITNCARNIKSNDETFKISTLPEFSDNLLEHINKFTTIMQSAEAIHKTFSTLHQDIEEQLNNNNNEEVVDLDEFEQHFNSVYEANLRDANTQSQALEVVNKILGISQNCDEDIVEEAPLERQWPKDPITKTNIKKAVRSKQCKHTYDKKSIEEYISQKERSNSTRIACPVAGCANKTLTRDDLEPDDAANNIIESFKNAS